MKKLLSMALCAAAVAAFAEETTITTVGVTAITLPEGQKNTIIAASFTELATGENISIANIVKATNLDDGDKILLYTDKNTYSAWSWSASDKAWTKADKTYTVGATGEVTESTGDASETTTVTVGTGLWIVRASETPKEAKIALYGTFVENKAYKTTAVAWNLVGNPTLKTQTITAGTAGDRIMVPTGTAGAMRTYEYGTEGENKGWYYVKATTTTTDGEAIAEITKKFEDPSIAAGAGFWYLTSSAVELKWAE